MVAARRGHETDVSPLFGRSEVLEAVGRELDRVREGTGGGVLLVGPGGIGKSHLLGRAIELAGERGFQIHTGGGLPADLPAPFSLLRRLLSAGEESPAKSGVGDSYPFVAPLLREAVTGESPPEAPTSETPAAPRSGLLEEALAPLGATAIEGLDAVRDEMLARLVDQVVERAHDRPLLLAIDDLHFADTSSLAFLERLSSELPKTRIAIIATAIDPVEAPPRTRPFLEALGRSPAFRSVPLRPLAASEVAEFATWILGGRAPGSEDVQRWHAQTEGNPLFVELLVRATTGSVGPPGDEAEDVTEMLVRRLHGLGEVDQRILTYGAILGKEFTFEDLAAVAGLEEERVTEALDRLVRDGILREKGDEVYEFVTEALRANVYAELTETRRRILHRKTGVALEEKGGANDVDLARHFYLGGLDEKAVDYNVRAAETATRAYAYDAAVSHIERALEAERRRTDRDIRREVRLLTEEGRLLDELGSWNRSDELLEEAVGLARAHPGADLELGRALLALAQTRVDRSEYPSAESLATEALIGLERWGTPLDLMAASRVLGLVAWRLGDLPRAEHHQRAVLEIAEREGTPLQQGHALVDIANTMVPRGGSHLQPALELFARAAALFDRAGEQSARARVIMDRGVLEYSVGMVEEAFRDVQTALTAAEEARSPLYIVYCLLNLAQWHAELGRPEPGAADLERAIVAVAPLGDRLAQQQIAMTHGMVAESEGRWDAAEAHYQDALAQARELRLVSETSEMLVRLARLSFLRGDRAEAAERLQEGIEAGILSYRPDFEPRVQDLQAKLKSDG
ncbi:MAG TPA: AAA family ATPase [Thermoplasmata archaeon]|nr:AAA family ATPase [Thermoplasmata archaeon]